jgi:hypothetical protein
MYQPRMTDDQCGAVGGISGTKCRFVRHKSHMT